MKWRCYPVRDPQGKWLTAYVRGYPSYSPGNVQAFYIIALGADKIGKTRPGIHPEDGMLLHTKDGEITNLPTIFAPHYEGADRFSRAAAYAESVLIEEA